MPLSESLGFLLQEYPKARQRAFAGDSLAEFLRVSLRDEIKTLVTLDSRYVVKGSAGQGNWARVPWVGIFNRLITESAQDGYYLVYLVKEDCTGLYLALGQGVTEVREAYGANAKEALKARAADFRARLGDIPARFNIGSLDLATAAGMSLGALYEDGAICAKYYGSSEIPADLTLADDLREMLALYDRLWGSETRSASTVSREDDEDGLSYEDLTRLRSHKRIERNQSLARRVKRIRGFACEACGLDFERQYGELGSGFIEAHHLQPLARRRGEMISLDPRRDFAVLCANCHRMIHRSHYVGDVDTFAARHLRNGREQ